MTSVFSWQNSVSLCPVSFLYSKAKLASYSRDLLALQHGYHQMVNIKLRLIMFFAATDGDILYSQQKQDLELTVAQIMSSLLPNKIENSD